MASTPTLSLLCCFVVIALIWPAHSGRDVEDDDAADPNKATAKAALLEAGSQEKHLPSFEEHGMQNIGSAGRGREYVDREVPTVPGLDAVRWYGMHEDHGQDEQAKTYKSEGSPAEQNNPQLGAQGSSTGNLVGHSLLAGQAPYITKYSSLVDVKDHQTPSDQAQSISMPKNAPAGNPLETIAQMTQLVEKARQAKQIKEETARKTAGIARALGLMVDARQRVLAAMHGRKKGDPEINVGDILPKGFGDSLTAALEDAGAVTKDDVVETIKQGMPRKSAVLQVDSEESDDPHPSFHSLTNDSSISPSGLESSTSLDQKADRDLETAGADVEQSRFRHASSAVEIHGSHMEVKGESASVSGNEEGHSEGSYPPATKGSISAEHSNDSSGKYAPITPSDFHDVVQRVQKTASKVEHDAATLLEQYGTHRGKNFSHMLHSLTQAAQFVQHTASQLDQSKPTSPKELNGMLEFLHEAEHNMGQTEYQLSVMKGRLEEMEKRHLPQHSAKASLLVLNSTDAGISEHAGNGHEVMEADPGTSRDDHDTKLPQQLNAKISQLALYSKESPMSHRNEDGTIVGNAGQNTAVNSTDPSQTFFESSHKQRN